MLDHLHQFTELAYQLGASFIQILEPVAVGHYAGKDVQLRKEHLAVLETFYEELTYLKKYINYPICIYHGYYQRKMGCFGSGDRSFYIDTNGDMLACPFCHVKTGNVLEGDMTNFIKIMRKKAVAHFHLQYPEIIFFHFNGVSITFVIPILKKWLTGIYNILYKHWRMQVNWYA